MYNKNAHTHSLSASTSLTSFSDLEAVGKQRVKKPSHTILVDFVSVKWLVLQQGNLNGNPDRNALQMWPLVCEGMKNRWFHCSGH